MEEKKKKLLEDIKFWATNEEYDSLSESQSQMRDLAKQDYKRTSCLEEIKWRQKAKVKWLKEGDQNTCFFHRIVSCRRNPNYIHSLVDDTGNEVVLDFLKDHIAA